MKQKNFENKKILKHLKKSITQKNIYKHIKTPKKIKVFNTNENNSIIVF